MLTCLNNSRDAVIVLHEIYGINRHIAAVCRQYSNRGYDVYCPHLLRRELPFDYCEQQQAYSDFIANGGFAAYRQVISLLREIRSRYRRIILAGFSIGATLAWISCGSGLCDGIIACYGSRIRDYPAVNPACPALCIFAEQEAAFSPASVDAFFRDRPGISVSVLAGRHGFCDPFSAEYHPASAAEAEKLTESFLAAFAPPILPRD
ncbi:MAG: dienelactone hydrolase family protein [Sporomusaceae bacterium]|nr:dienelactone hydrolase family protein [Sporomusaceae bacterium]